MPRGRWREGLIRAEGAEGRGKARQQDTARSPSAGRGGSEVWTVPELDPPIAPSQTQLLLQLPDPEPPASRNSKSREWEQQRLPKISCPAVPGKIIEGCSQAKRGVVRIFWPSEVFRVVKVKETSEKLKKASNY